MAAFALPAADAADRRHQEVAFWLFEAEQCASECRADGIELSANHYASIGQLRRECDALEAFIEAHGGYTPSFFLQPGSLEHDCYGLPF